MLPAKALLLICPYCGNEKPIMRIASGNTIGGSQRSDLKTDYPMLPEASAVQCCPQCGKYYFARLVKTKEASYYSSDKGELNYEEITEALHQLLQQPLEKRDEVNLRLLFIQSYNTKYQLEGVENLPVPTNEEQQLFRQQITRLLEIWEVQPLLKAEFLREAGRFDECLEELSTLKFDSPFESDIADRIRFNAESHSSKVFII